MALCQYKDALGAPNTGVHAVGGFAIADILLTGSLALFISKTFKMSSIVAFIMLVIFAILIRAEFCVNTRLNSIIFGRSFP